MFHDRQKRMLPRSFWYSVGVYLVFNSLFLALVIFKPGTHRQFVIMDDVGQALGWLLGTLLCLVGLRSAFRKVSSRAESLINADSAGRWLPLLFAAGIFCQFIGQVIYTIYDIQHLKDFPSWADVGYLSTFPFFFIGIYLLPTRPSLRRPARAVVASGSKALAYPARAAASVSRWARCPFLLRVHQKQLPLTNQRTWLKHKSPLLLNHRAPNLDDLIA